MEGNFNITNKGFENTNSAIRYVSSDLLRRMPLGIRTNQSSGLSAQHLNWYVASKENEEWKLIIVPELNLSKSIEQVIALPKSHNGISVEITGYKLDNQTLMFDYHVNNRTLSTEMILSPTSQFFSLMLGKYFR